MSVLIPFGGKSENFKILIHIADIQVGHSFYTIGTHPDNEFEYCCPQIQTVLGFSHHELSSKLLQSRIHPADRISYSKYEQITSNFFSFLSPEKKLKYKARSDFRMKHKQGHDVRVVKQTMTAKNDPQKFGFQIFNIYTDITHLKSTDDMTLSFIGMDGEPSFHNVHLPNLPTVKQLSARENEILNLISQNNTSGEIAKILNISKHTVNNHRKNILRKTGSRGILELLTKGELNWSIKGL